MSAQRTTRPRRTAPTARDRVIDAARAYVDALRDARHTSNPDATQAEENALIAAVRDIDDPTQATRAEAFEVVLAGIAAGLPIPETINTYHFGSLSLRLDDDDQEAVDRWIRHLDMPAPELRGVRNEGRFRSYKSETPHGKILPGWSVQVYCDATVQPEAANGQTTGGTQ